MRHEICKTVAMGDVEIRPKGRSYIFLFLYPLCLSISFIIMPKGMSYIFISFISFYFFYFFPITHYTLHITHYYRPFIFPSPPFKSEPNCILW